jgi:predicted molibdopterin-dependent oxidoreductase YjgC
MLLKYLISMVKIKIDNVLYEVPEGSTVLTVARSAGFKISTLCHKEGMPHYSSCMVCMVKDNKTTRFIPSCSAIVQEGMEIDISGEDVISLRRKAIELLLSEHRAECEAPCKVVCPAGYNIPLFNRLIGSQDFEAAINLTTSEINSNEIHCVKCAGYCENACRRKKVDLPVSIRNMKLFISQNIITERPDSEFNIQHINNVTVKGSTSDLNRSPKRFASHIGKLETVELQEWLKECEDNTTRSREITNNNIAVSEALNCMHCDCRAAEDCRLREIAEEYSIKDPRGKLVNSPIIKKINHKTGLIFENAKCIKCGLCVRLCEDSKEEPALCFINRGFISIISEPLTEEFNNILKTKSKEVVDICPTGALSQIK